eukprot:m.90213 g.90213  ORF g.90213 m.90213 type:complete len:55 (+) comp11820_c0_seq1:89-253(+)
MTQSQEFRLPGETKRFFVTCARRFQEKDFSDIVRPRLTETARTVARKTRESTVI